MGAQTMDLRQLVTFRMVATTLSFTRAAAALNYVQSNVTAQIHALEEELGIQLFDRLGKRVALTDAGQVLLDYAERILNLADEARVAVSQSTIPTGSLTVTAPETLCTYRLPVLLREFRVRYPQVQMVFKPCRVADLRRSVSDGVVDVAFLLQEPMQSTSLIVEPLIQEPLVVIAPPDHPLAARSSVSPIDLEDEPILFTELGCSYRNLFEQQLITDGVYPKANLEFNSVEAIKQCVINGMGIAVLPAVVAANDIAQGRLVALRWSEPDFQVVTQMCWHKDKWMSPALSAFLTLAREMLCAIPDDTLKTPA
jgi:DNA-binding transcriptional LysR family regulator